MQKNHKNIFRTELFSKKSYPLSGLESYLGEAASVSRQLTKSHRYAFRVRRSSDNAVMDIGFRNGESDISTLLNFCNGGSGFVQLLYGCNGSIFANDNTGKEPRVVNSGVLDVSNNKPTMVFDGSNDALWCANNVNIDILNQKLYISQVLTPDLSIASPAYILNKNNDSGANNQYAFLYSNATDAITSYLEGNVDNLVISSNNTIPKGVQSMYSMSWMNNEIKAYVQGIASGTTDTYSGTLTSRNYLTIGARQSTSSNQATWLKGSITEFCILKGNPKQTDFETKTKKYYGII